LLILPGRTHEDGEKVTLLAGSIGEGEQQIGNILIDKDG
jgi:hypothetical protein